MVLLQKTPNPASTASASDRAPAVASPEDPHTKKYRPRDAACCQGREDSRFEAEDGDSGPQREEKSPKIDARKLGCIKRKQEGKERFDFAKQLMKRSAVAIPWLSSYS